MRNLLKKHLIQPHLLLILVFLFGISIQGKSQIIDNLQISLLTYPSGDNISCNGFSDGEATATFDIIDPAGPPLSFQWSDGQTGTVASNLSAGTIVLTVIDANSGDILDNQVAILQEPPSPLALSTCGDQTVTPDFDPSRYAQIKTTVTGGRDPYTFTWDSGESTERIIVDPAIPTTYSVTVTDVNGCQVTGGSFVDVLNTLDKSEDGAVERCRNRVIVFCHQRPSSSLLMMGEDPCENGPGDHTKHPHKFEEHSFIPGRKEYRPIEPLPTCHQGLLTERELRDLLKLRAPTGEPFYLYHGDETSCGDSRAFDELLDPTCGEFTVPGCLCIDGIKGLGFEYTGNPVSSVTFINQDGDSVGHFTSVNPGDILTADNQGDSLEFVFIYLDGQKVAEYTPDCESDMIGTAIPFANMTIVSFVDLANFECNGSTPGFDCECEGPLESLIFEYLGPPGDIVFFGKGSSKSSKGSKSKSSKSPKSSKSGKSSKSPKSRKGTLLTFEDVQTGDHILLTSEALGGFDNLRGVEYPDDDLEDCNILPNCDEIHPGVRFGFLEVVGYEDANGNTCNFDPSNVVEKTGGNTWERQVADNASLKAYPNPFSNSFSIRIGLDHEDEVKVNVYDINGRVVGALFDGALEAGANKTLEFTPKSQAGGIYMVVVETASGERHFKKMIKK